MILLMNSLIPLYQTHFKTLLFLHKSLKIILNTIQEHIPIWNIYNFNINPDKCITLSENSEWLLNSWLYITLIV